MRSKLLPHVNPRLHLKDLLRKRKRTLADWIKESGIATYAELLRWCKAVGVNAPTEAEWHALHPRPVSSPSDGVIVIGEIEPPPAVAKKDRKRRNGLVELPPELAQVAPEVPTCTQDAAAV
jgi:hypothetical protein